MGDSKTVPRVPRSVANGTFGRRDWGFKVGQVVGEWTITSDAYFARKGRDVVHDTRCSCGHVSTTLASNLFSGKSTRCRKCARAKAAETRKSFYGYAYICPQEDHRVRLMSRIAACINRCGNANDKNFANYGGRGIRVHERWLTARHEFLAYLMTLPGWDVPALELDRTDCDKGYEPDNLRFVSRSENAKNKRKMAHRERTIGELKDEIEQLRARLRHCKCRASQEIHGADEDGRGDCT